MTRTLVSTGSAFEKAVGYSRAVAQGPWCFVSGTTGLNYQTMAMPESAAEQASNALATIGKALAEAGFALSDVIKATYYIAEPKYWDEIGPSLGAVFGDIRPAATCVVAQLIMPEMKVEIEVTAFKG